MTKQEFLWECPYCGMIGDINECCICQDPEDPDDTTWGLDFL